MARKQGEVYCFDGDAAAIMHMGSLAQIGSIGPKNFKHIIFNNGSHDSVGGQPTGKKLFKDYKLFSRPINRFPKNCYGMWV